MYAPNHSGVATEMVAIVTSDVSNLATRLRGLYVGVGGNINCRDGKGNVVLLQNVPAGTIIPAEFTKIAQTGTTASAMVGLV
jgi:hypothetical protein